MTLETTLESRITEACNSRGILCLKLAIMFGRGFPDRSLLKDGKVLFLEIKRPDGKGQLRAIQSRWLEILQGKGFRAEVVDDFDKAIKLIKETFDD